VCCGIAPRNIGRAEFKNFVSALNANYNLISRTTFEDSLVPAYAANVRIAVIKSCWFLTISGDGGKLKRKKFVSVNITTIHRQSFCVDLDDVSRISQTGEYFAELFKKVISVPSCLLYLTDSILVARDNWAVPIHCCNLRQCW
jgi:hypothetical protein